MHHFKVIVRDELYEDMYCGIGLTNYKTVTRSRLQLQNTEHEQRGTQCTYTGKSYFAQAIYACT